MRRSVNEIRRSYEAIDQLKWNSMRVCMFNKFLSIQSLCSVPLALSRRMQNVNLGICIRSAADWPNS